MESAREADPEPAELLAHGQRSDRAGAGRRQAVQDRRPLSPTARLREVALARCARGVRQHRPGGHRASRGAVAAVGRGRAARQNHRFHQTVVSAKALRTCGLDTSFVHVLRGHAVLLFEHRDKLVPVQPFAPLTNTDISTLGAQPALILKLQRYTAPFDLTGHPTVTLPGGFSERNMPIGIQLAGRDETMLIRAAVALQRETPWPERHPLP